MIPPQRNWPVFLFIPVTVSWQLYRSPAARELLFIPSRFIIVCCTLTGALGCHDANSRRATNNSNKRMQQRSVGGFDDTQVLGFSYRIVKSATRYCAQYVLLSTVLSHHTHTTAIFISVSPREAMLGSALPTWSSKVACCRRLVQLSSCHTTLTAEYPCR
jgi:hypothetical protein